ncbi:hypothetical protein [Streptomyces sp. NPDC007100]
MGAAVRLIATCEVIDGASHAAGAGHGIFITHAGQINQDLLGFIADTSS